MCTDALAFFANCRGQLKLGDFGLARLYHADDKRYMTFVCMIHCAVKLCMAPATYTHLYMEE